MAATRKHIVTLSMPMFGHIMPTIELAKKFVDQDYDVTFVLSASKTEETKTRAMLKKRYSDRITFYPLEDGLPQDIDTSPSPDHIHEIMNAMDEPVKKLLQQMTPASENPTPEITKDSFAHVNAIITDLFFVSPVSVCKEQGLPCFMFNPAPALALMGVILITEETPICSSEQFFKPPQEALDIKNGITEPLKKLILQVKNAAPQARGFITNSFRELEGFVADAFAAYPPLANIPLKFVGPLLQHNVDHCSTTESMLKWLDIKEAGSVVYISFGSMVFPSADQLKQLAIALTKLGQPFLWSLRTSQQINLPEEMQELIKHQFDSVETGFLVLPWVAQQTVLAHPAVKVFVSHCGWNSTLETITAGKPVVGWPMFGDQHVNATLLGKMGMGVKIPGTSLQADRIVPADEICIAIGKVGGWTGEFKGNNPFCDAAEKLKNQARSAIAPGGSSYEDFLELATKLITY